MAYTPKLMTRDGETVVSQTRAHEAWLLFEGWTAEGPFVPPRERQGATMADIDALTELISELDAEVYATPDEVDQAKQEAIEAATALVDGLKGSAPEAYDTLVEVAAALDENADAHAALIATIATKITASQADQRVREATAWGGGAATVGPANTNGLSWYWSGVYVEPIATITIERSGWYWVPPVAENDPTLAVYGFRDEIPPLTEEDPTPGGTQPLISSDDSPKFLEAGDVVALAFICWDAPEYVGQTVSWRGIAPAQPATNLRDLPDTEPAFPETGEAPVWQSTRFEFIPVTLLWQHEGLEGRVGTAETRLDSVEIDAENALGHFVDVQNKLYPYAKGELISGSAPFETSRLSVGANGARLLAASSAAGGIKWSTTTVQEWTGGPEGGISAGPGSLYHDTAVTNGIALWVKTSGTGNTGWEPLARGIGPRAVATVDGTNTYAVTPGLLGAARRINLAANLTVTVSTNPSTAIHGAVLLSIHQAASGGPYTVTWPATLEWSGDVAPTMPTPANSELIVQLLWTGAAWRAAVVGTYFP